MRMLLSIANMPLIPLSTQAVPILQNLSPVIPLAFQSSFADSLLEKMVTHSRIVASKARRANVQRHRAHLLWSIKEAAVTKACHLSSGTEFS